MKRILMMGLTPPLEGGSERHIYEISSRIPCTVLTQKNSSCKNKIGISIIKSPTILRNFSFLISSFFYSLFLLFTFRRKFDLIHIHENLLYVLAPILKIRYTVIITVHGIEGFKFYDNKRLWLFFRNCLRFADCIIAVNLQDKKNLEKTFKKVVYFPNGVDLSIYTKIKPKIEKKITFIGRVHEQKGIIYLLKAFEKISEKFPDFKLEIIGKIDSYGQSLKDKYSDRKIMWRGTISDRKEIVRSLKSAYCIALPSLWEGLPLTLFESLATGRPVVLSDIEAFKSVVNKEAFFFKSKNEGSLAEVISQVMLNKKESEKIGAAGKELAKNYDWNKIAKDMERFYNEQ